MRSRMNINAMRHACAARSCISAEPFFSSFRRKRRIKGPKGLSASSHVSTFNITPEAAGVAMSWMS